MQDSEALVLGDDLFVARELGELECDALGEAERVEPCESLWVCETDGSDGVSLALCEPLPECDRITDDAELLGAWESVCERPANCEPDVESDGTALADPDEVRLEFADFEGGSVVKGELIEDTLTL